MLEQGPFASLRLLLGLLRAILSTGLLEYLFKKILNEGQMHG